jgi:circadian clock protein KaiB
MNRPVHFKFRLYVAGDAPNSVQAVANLGALCREFLAGRHEIEVVDVLREPQRAQADGVVLTPMLVKLQPAPGRKIVGTLSKTQTVLQALGLSVETATQ